MSTKTRKDPKSRTNRRHYRFRRMPGCTRKERIRRNYRMAGSGAHPPHRVQRRAG